MHTRIHLPQEKQPLYSACIGILHQDFACATLEQASQVRRRCKKLGTRVCLLKITLVEGSSTNRSGDFRRLHLSSITVIGCDGFHFILVCSRPSLQI